MKDRRNIFYWVGFVAGVFALAVQIPLTITNQMALGSSFLGGVVYFFSFFTNWTNILLVLIYLAHMPAFSDRMSILRASSVKASALAAIIMVMIVYHLLLAADHNPVGIDAITNIIMHYISPVVFTVWWFSIGREQKLVWNDIAKFLLWPIAYLVFTYTRAAIGADYPYDFLNLALNGVAGVAPVVGAIVILIVLLASLAIFIDQKVPVTNDR